MVLLILGGVGHPFDLTKTRLQTAAPGVYKGALHVVRQTLARDGVSGWVPFFCPLFSVTLSVVYSQIISRDGTPTPRGDPNICCIFLGAFSNTPNLELSYHSDSFTIYCQAYDASKKLIFALTPKRTTERLSTAELAAAGFMSAVPTTLITAPVERAKVMLQVSHTITTPFLWMISVR